MAALKASLRQRLRVFDARTVALLLCVALAGCSVKKNPSSALLSHPPVISAPRTVSATTGEEVRFDFAVSDPDGDAITGFRVTAGVGLNGGFIRNYSPPITGAVVWIPCKAGTYTTTIMATSGDPPQSTSLVIEIVVTGVADSYIDIPSGGTITPDTLNISVGQTVAWRNLDANYHQISPDTTFIDLSRFVEPGCESRSMMFESAGSFPFVCLIHPAERWVVKVSP